jgi:hypothetical protein
MSLKSNEAALAGDLTVISSTLGKPDEISTIAEIVQARRLARLLYVPPETAVTIARLAYGEAR